MLHLRMFNQLKSLGRFRRKKIIWLLSNDSHLNLAHEKTIKQWKVIFYGSDSFSEVTLRVLNHDRLSFNGANIIQNLEVVCPKSDCAVRRYALLNNLTLHTWPFSLPLNVYDVGVVVSFGHMIPSESILACKYGIINAHPSLLPRWRGAAPIFHTILNGDTETGVTITQVSPNKFDVGNIVMQEHYTIPTECSSKALSDRLSKIASTMILKTLDNLPYYIKSNYPQPADGAKYAHKIKPKNCCINWEQDSSLHIDRKFKAFDGFFDLYTFWKDMKIIILGIANMEETSKANVSSLVSESVKPGYCYFHKKRKILYVKCQDGWTGISLLRIPKRGKITALDFYNGFLSREKSENCYLSSNL